MSQRQACVAWEVLKDRGLKLTSTWLEQCNDHLDRAVPNFSSLPVPDQVNHYYLQFLNCDLNTVGAGSLPTGIADMLKGKLEGRYIVQVDEMVDIAHPAQVRYRGGNNKTCLRLSLTDGVQRVHALEYKRIQALQPHAPAGLKIVLSGEVTVRRGTLLLQPENVHVLGGEVAHLEAARCRMVEYMTLDVADARLRRIMGHIPDSHSRVEGAAHAAWSEPVPNQPPQRHQPQQHQPQQDDQHQPQRQQEQQQQSVHCTPPYSGALETRTSDATTGRPASQAGAVHVTPVQAAVRTAAGTSPAPWDARDEPSASHHFPLGESPHLRQNNGSAAGFSFPHLPVPGSVAEPEAGARASEAGSAGSSRLRLRGRDGKEVGARDAETQERRRAAARAVLGSSSDEDQDWENARADNSRPRRLDRPMDSGPMDWEARGITDGARGVTDEARGVTEGARGVAEVVTIVDDSDEEPSQHPNESRRGAASGRALVQDSSARQHFLSELPAVVRRLPADQFPFNVQLSCALNNLKHFKYVDEASRLRPPLREFDTMVILEDGSDFAQIPIASAWMEGMLGYSPAQMDRVLNHSQEHETDVLQKCRARVAEVQQYLSLFVGIADLTFTGRASPPTITALREHGSTSVAGELQLLDDLQRDISCRS